MTQSRINLKKAEKTVIACVKDTDERHPYLKTAVEDAERYFRMKDFLENYRHYVIYRRIYGKNAYVRKNVESLSRSSSASNRSVCRYRKTYLRCILKFYLDLVTENRAEPLPDLKEILPQFDLEDVRYF